jgi:hypothetical protein
MFRAFALAVALLAQASFSVAAAGPTAPSDETSAGGLAPGIHWEEARAHEDDRIAFTAGERVSVGFKPRPEDRWVVGGVTPRSLPPGRLDGKRMRLQKPADPVDRPVVDESDVIDATAASWSPPAAPEARTPQARVGAGLRREVFGFLPYWQVGSSSLASTTTRSRRSPTSASVPRPTGRSSGATPMARRRSAGAAGRAPA